jgi:hypothetical protein
MQLAVKERLSQFTRYKETDKDDSIIQKCIDGIYKEDDFIHATRMLFKTTKSSTITPFSDKSVFIKFRNMNREFYPSWVNDLSADDKGALKRSYLKVLSHCFWNHSNQYKCEYPDILELIHAYHKEAIPYWVIECCITETIDTYRNPITKNKLIEFMNNSERFKKICREIFKKHLDFKKKNINLFEVGKKLEN